MNALHFDLLGYEIPVQASPEKAVAAPRKGPAPKVVINRRALWSSSGYLPGITEAGEEDDVPNVTQTSDTYSDNSTIERLEKAIGLSPVIRDGRWVNDEHGGYVYRVTGKPFKGQREMGPDRSMVRECNIMLVLQSARAAVEAVFVDPCSWLCLHSVNVLSVRLRRLTEHEDPFELLAVFCRVMQEHDFIDNSRKGETIRNIAKRERIREVRAERRKQQQDALTKSDVPGTDEEGSALE